MSIAYQNIHMNPRLEFINSNIKLSDESIIFQGVRLFRIIANRNFNSIRKGTKGGYVESTRNISKQAWIADEAKVYGNALITDNAIAKDEAEISDCAIVSGYAKIEKNALVCKSAQVSQCALISGRAEIRGIVYGHAMFTCRAFVDQHEIVTGLAA